MNDQMLDDLAIERVAGERFAVNFDITEVIARGVPTSATSQATIFKTRSGAVYVFLSSQSALVLDDVLKMIRRMNCDVDQTLPPYGEIDYFERIGREKFKTMFPGKHITSDDDLRYYKNLASYNPALIRLSKIKGEIYGWEPAGQAWRKVKNYAYSKIKPIKKLEI